MKRFFLCAALVGACSSRATILPDFDASVAADRGAATDLGTATDVPTKGSDVPPAVDAGFPEDAQSVVDVGFPEDAQSPADLGLPCSSDGACRAADLVCDLGRGVCVECVRTEDCLVTGQVCASNRCVAGFDSGTPPVDVVTPPVDAVTPPTDRGTTTLTDRGVIPDAGPGAALLAGLGGPNGYGPLENCLTPSDDGSYVGPAPEGGVGSSAITLGTGFGTGLLLGAMRYPSVFLNNNGNLTLRRVLNEFTSARFPRGSGEPMIAPWWGDVDTRGGGHPSRNHVCFVSEPSRLVATWYRVGYYTMHDDRQNSFQVIITPAGAAGSGDFDAEFRYGLCQWTTGDASGGTGGLGGTPAQAGIDVGDSTNAVSLPGSGTADVLYLCTTSNVGIPGVWRVQVRSGVPRNPI